MSSGSSSIDNNVGSETEKLLSDIRDRMYRKRKEQVCEGVVKLLESTPKGIQFNLIYQTIYSITKAERQSVRTLLTDTFKKYLEGAFNTSDATDFLTYFCDVWDKYYSGLSHIKKLFSFYVKKHKQFS